VRAAKRFVILSGEARQKMLLQERQIFLSVGQPRELDLYHGKAEVQVFPELFLGDHRFEVTVGCSHDPNVDSADFRRANPLQFMILKNTQELALHGQRHVADFIKKKRAAIRVLDQPDPILCRTSERSFDIPKEFTLKKRFGHCRTIANNQTFRRDWAQLVQGVCHEFLAAACGPRHQRDTVVRRHPPDSSENLQHLRTSSDHAFKSRSLQQLTFQLESAMPFPRICQEAVNALAQSFWREGLCQVVACTLLDSLDRRFGRVVAGYENRIDARVELDDLLEKASVSIVIQGRPSGRPVSEQTTSTSSSVWSMWPISKGRSP